MPSVGGGGLEEADGAPCLLVGHDLAEGDARGVVDADVNVLPTGAAELGGAPVALPPAIAGDAMSDTLEAAELFGIEVDELAGPLVATDRLRWLQIAHPA